MRLVFKEIKEFRKWAIDNASVDRHEYYITEKKEIIIVPLRSTRPIKYAIATGVSDDILKEITKRLGNLGFRVYRVKAVEWSDDRPIGAKTSIE